MQRSLMRRWIVAGLWVFGLAVMAALVRPPAAQAAGTVGTGTAASCTEAALRAALTGGGLVTFNCGANPVVIAIAGEIPINQPTTLNGGGLVTLDGGFVTRIFGVGAGSLTLQNIGLQNGRSGFGWGGAISVSTTAGLTAINTRFTGNASGIQSGGRGGAIFSAGGPISISTSLFQSNFVEGDGGGAIYALGPVGLLNTDFISNTAFNLGPTLGGALYTEGPLDIQGGTFRGNNTGSADSGGAIYALEKMRAQGALFVNNFAGNGGAIYLAANSSLESINTNVRV